MATYSREQINEEMHLYFDQQYAKQYLMSAIYRNHFLKQSDVLVGEPDTSVLDGVSQFLEEHIADLMKITHVTNAGLLYTRSKEGKKKLSGGLEKVVENEREVYYPEKRKRGGKEQLEKYIAKFMNQKPYGEIGKIMSIEVPLNQRISDGNGKIDMLGYDSNSHRVSILELKKPTSNESILRCVMEAFTYYRQLDCKKLLEDFREDFQKEDDKLENSAIPKKLVTFAISPLVYEGGRAYNDLVNDLAKDKESDRHLSNFMYALSKELNTEAKEHGLGGAVIRPLCYKVNAAKTNYEVKRIKGWDYDV